LTWQSTAGVLCPVPRGSKPTMSNRALSAAKGPLPTVCNRSAAGAPGPPRLKNREPMRCSGWVAGTLATAICTCSPSGSP
jgi:hypothetical protein